MFQKIKNKTRFFLILVFIFASLLAYVCIIKNDVIAAKAKNNGYVSFSVLLYGTENVFPQRLDAYKVLYDKKNNILKVLSVNTDIVILKKNERARSLKALFNENVEKNTDTAVKEFYSDLHEIIGFNCHSDFYINISFEQLNAVMGQNKKLKDIFSKDNFEDRDLESLNRLETIEHILHLMPYKALRIYKNYGFLDTDIARFSFVRSILRLGFLKPDIMFCIMPVKYVRGRIEPDRQNIKEFLEKIYFAVNVSGQMNAKDVFIDVKNASNKPHMAEKTTWLLRENKFDVLDWSNSLIAYDKTLIKDYKGNFLQDLKISKILNAGKIIISYNNRVCSDISVFIGKDCVIDSHKKGERNEKN